MQYEQFEQSHHYLRTDQCMIGVGLLDDLVVLIVHVDSDETIRIISMRKADGNETDLHYQNIGWF